MRFFGSWFFAWWLALPSACLAYPFVIDNFRVAVDGETVFHDDFGDGEPPPSAGPTGGPWTIPDGSGPRFVFGPHVGGTFGPEADGKLRLEFSDAGVRRGPFTSEPGHTAFTPALVPVGASFEITSLWDWLPAGPNPESQLLSEAYGMEVGNAGLFVGYSAVTQGTAILGGRSDGTPFPILVVPLSVELGPPDQIRLRLSYDGTVGGDIVSSFDFLAQGETLSRTELGSRLFLRPVLAETLTVSLVALGVPEPSALALLASASLLAATHSRREKR
jgi:hypothetical protein